MCESRSEARRSGCGCFDSKRSSSSSWSLAVVAALVIAKIATLVAPGVVTAYRVVMAVWEITAGVMSALVWAGLAGLVIAVGSYGMTDLLARCATGQGTSEETSPARASVPQEPVTKQGSRDGAREAGMPRSGDRPGDLWDCEALCKLRSRRHALAARLWGRGAHRPGRHGEHRHDQGDAAVSVSRGGR
ncbi:MAG: hypothetical protein ACRDJF_10875 [Actinomycetota bacterium]